MALITTHKITIFNKTYDQNAKIVFKPKFLRGYMPISLTTQGINGVDAQVEQARAYISIRLYGSRYRMPQQFTSAKSKDGLWTLATGDKICLGWFKDINDTHTYTIEDVKIFSDGPLAHFEVTAK